MAPAKAAAAAAAVKAGTGKKLVKRRTKVHFYKPKSFKPPSDPKYARKSVPSRVKMDKRAPASLKTGRDAAPAAPRSGDATVRRPRTRRAAAAAIGGPGAPPRSRARPSFAAGASARPRRLPGTA